MNAAMPVSTQIQVELKIKLTPCLLLKELKELKRTFPPMLGYGMKRWPLDPTCLFTLKRKLDDEDIREDQPGKHTDLSWVKK